MPPGPPSGQFKISELPVNPSPSFLDARPVVSEGTTYQQLLSTELSALDAYGVHRVHARATSGTLADIRAGDTIDDYELQDGDRLYFGPETAEDGIYVVSTSEAPERALDMVEGLQVSGHVIVVRNGTSNVGAFYISDAISIVGTDAQTLSAFGGGGADALTADMTINVDNTMTAAEINAAIAAAPRNTNGFNLRIIFADGTYTLAARLLVSGFYGGGTVWLQNAAASGALSTGQAVILNAVAASPGWAIQVTKCECRVNIYGVKVLNGNPSGGCIQATAQSGTTYVIGCYLDGTGASFCVNVSNALGYIANCYVTASNYAVASNGGGYFYAVGNASTGTNPVYAYRAFEGIIQYRSNSITGSTGLKNEDGGGKIFP